MPPEELQKQIARVKEKEHVDAEKMHDILLSRQRMDESVSKHMNIDQRASDKKKIATVVAVAVLLILGFLYAQKNGFWMNKAEVVQNKVIEQAMKRMEEVTKSNPPVTEADVTSATNAMSDFRAQEKASQTKKK